MNRWHTRNGISIPTQELCLPKTNLDISKDNTQNNHHNEWTRRAFGESVLLQVVRDLGCHQEMLPLDVHEWVHDKFDPPKPPTPYQAMEEIERARACNEMLRPRKNGKYINKAITDLVMEQCYQEYNFIAKKEVYNKHISLPSLSCVRG